MWQVVVIVSVVGIGLVCLMVLVCACSIDRDDPLKRNAAALKRERRVSALYDPII